MKCNICNKEIEKAYCEICYGGIFSDLWSKIMISPDNQFTELKFLIQDLNNKIDSLKQEFDKLNEALKDFKIKGLKLNASRELMKARHEI